MRWHKIAGSITVVAVSFAIGFVLREQQREASPKPRQAVPLAEVGIPAAEAPAFDPQRFESVLVARVIDGDTVELQSGERVRLIGIDAPERGSCFADQSAGILSVLTSGGMVKRAWGVVRQDRYGRSLNYLYDGSTFINEALVERGAAVAAPSPPNILYAPKFAEAEARAREAKRGLWGMCGGLTEDTEPTDVAVPTGCTIKGNVASSGERIYHLPGCASYEKTRIDESAGERWFCTESEAQAAGFRKAKNCP